MAGDCIEPNRVDLKDPVTGEWIDPGVHGWVYEETIQQKTDGPFQYIYEAGAAGDLADALLLTKLE